MAKEIKAFQDKNGRVFLNESDADKSDITDDIIKTMKNLDFNSNDICDLDLTTYNLEELKRIGRMAEKYLSL